MRKLRHFAKVLLPLLLAATFIFYWFSLKEVPVLMYHFVGTKTEAADHPLMISIDTFKSQIQLLKKWGYRVYSLAEFYEIKTGKKELRQKGVVITFDDGNRDFVEDIFPIIEKENVPVANFLIWDNLSKGTMGSMSMAEAKNLLKSPLITFGAHTIHHKVLVNLSDQELEEEIAGSKRYLEEALGIPILYFAYPGGYFDDRSIAKVEKSGYRLAFTTSRRRLGEESETRYSRVRTKVKELDANPVSFWVKASGVYTLFKKLRWKILSYFEKLDYRSQPLPKREQDVVLYSNYG